MPVLHKLEGSVFNALAHVRTVSTLLCSILGKPKIVISADNTDDIAHGQGNLNVGSTIKAVLARNRASGAPAVPINNQGQ